METRTKEQCIVYAENCVITDEVKSHQYGITLWHILQSTDLSVPKAEELTRKIILSIFPSFFE